MGAEIVNVSGGVLTVKVSGKLTQTELATLQQATGEIIGKQGKLRILVLTENFTGWERGGAWGDFSFQAENDASIERMAIVGDRKWEDLALMFIAKGLRKFPIEYFEPARLAAARDWLAAK
jgi:SpoIIAA-like